MSRNSTDTDWGELAPTQAWKAAQRYAALGDRSRVQRASTVISGVISLTTASLVGMVIGRGSVAAVAGTDRAYQVLTGFRILIGAAIGVALGTLMATTVPTTYSLWGPATLGLIGIGWIVAILPSIRFHRSRGLRLNGPTWKRSHGVRQLWIVTALAHDPEATADELEAALRTLVPDLGPGWAYILFTTTDVQVQALQCLGFSRACENSGLMYRTVTAAQQV
ncbi:hypothetical protein [Arthrobacter bambusae]|uniref:hypothetical protein n=1 Tax=Arthrobacter bambusae TaxID=1338426 RepID=UPI00278706A9|nr:hypothetical protein [Arthrobacter bambusae]MDQ0240857.1 hypothetical protein [Arthrobacter bambusae]